MHCTGEFRLNGAEYDKNVLKQMSGYVMQDDLLSAFLTVWETLRYAAGLRMGYSFSREERDLRCEEVLSIMGILYCKDVIVGDSRNKGNVSGMQIDVSICFY